MSGAPVRLRVALLTAGAPPLGLTIHASGSATVRDLARAVLRSGLVSAPERRRLGAGDQGTLTLGTVAPSAPPAAEGAAVADAPEILLDQAAPLRDSGLRSGDGIRLRTEFPGPPEPREAAADIPRVRAVPLVGRVRVLSGPQRGAVFGIAAGVNRLGRARQHRIPLRGTGVSRTHAAIEAGHPEHDGLLLRDLGSANGVRVRGEPVQALRITEPVIAQLGEVTIRIDAGPVPVRGGAARPLEAARPRERDHRHTRSPAVRAASGAAAVPLPQPPAPGEPARFPVLGVLGPLVFGIAVFAASGSRLSLALLGLSPFLALAAWADARLTARRKRRAADARFEAALAAARAELAELRGREQRARHRGSPDPGRIADAITARNGLLWSRRRDAPDVLELRLGTGRARSRVRAELPAPNDAEPEHWRRLRAAARDAEELPGVPRTERLGACGALGVVGPAGERDGLARSLLLQLAALHAPTDLVIAAFAPEPKHRERAGWGWLGWLPHQGAASSPLRGPHLAGTPERSEALLAELEGIIRARSGESATAARPGPSRDDCPAIVVLIEAGAPGNRARLIGIAEAGAAVGVHALWLADRPERVPAACRSVVVVVPGPGTTAELIRTRAGRRVALDRVEHVAAAPAAQLARCLAPIVDDSERAPADHGLPRLAHLRELAARDLVGGAADILAAWAETDSLSGSWRPGTPRRVTGLAAIIGQDATGPLSVDLRAQGPHALIGGTTGSGKSEFLQSWIMSLAAQHSPERVTFLLVDYKGGNAFAECAQLPHTVGLVSDLTPELLRRALISLRAELAHREQRLNALGAKDLAELEARSEADAPPALLVVVDELAALTAAVPEFLDGLLDVAQRGRSLGVHLLLATQRPAGAVTANLRANLNLRIALRVADPEDSTDLLGVADAAGFDPGVPGRAALRVGSGPVRRFQSAYLGGRGGAAADTPGLADAGSAITAGAPGGVALSGLGFAEGVPLPGAQEHRRSAGAHHAPGPRGPRDIEALRDSIAVAVASAGLAPPRRPWLDPLPERLSLAELPGLSAPGIALGLRDEPGQQRQRGYALDLARSGNAALIGASGSGKTSALVTLAVAANAASSPSADSRGGGLHAHAPTHCYAIDAGGGLGGLAALPTVGAVVPVEDAERIGRLLALFRDTITARVRATPPVSPAPRLLLLLDGFPAFRAVAEEHSPRAELLDQLGEILRTGRAVGVHAVLTADRPAAFGTEIAATLQEQLVLRLAAAEDAGALGVPAAVLADAPAGRAVLAGGTDPVQLALVATNASRDTGMPAPEPMAEIAAQLRVRGVPPARPVPPLPERLRRAELPAPLIGAPPIFAIDTATLEPVGFPLGARCAVSGPAGSGLSTALRAMIEAFLGAARPGAPRAPAAAVRLSGPAGPGDHPEPAERFLAGVLASLESAEASERPELIALELGPDDLGAEGEPLLSGVLAAAARVGSTVLLGAEQDALQASWPLLAELKRARWLLALRPHAEGGSPLVRVSLPRPGRAGDRPGRGVVVARGRARSVQVALPAQGSDRRESAREPGKGGPAC